MIQVLKRFRLLFIYGLPAVWFAALLLVLNATNPIEAGPASILGVFALIYLFIFSTLYAASHLVAKIWQAVRHKGSIDMRRAYYVISIISLAPVLMIALNTLGQLEITELVLIVILVAVGCFYVVRRSGNS